MPTHDLRRTIRRLIIAIAVVSAMLTVACWPTSRFVGVDHVITEQRVPLWAKAVDFVHRDENVSQTSRAVLGGLADDERRVTAAMAWTRAHIRNAPPGLPIVDDHIWHIIIRGYGQSDQQADVFTTLLAYAGTRAYWDFVGEHPDEIPISYAWIRGDWRVFDVAAGLAFRNARGELATPAEIAADHELIRSAAATVMSDTGSYVAHFNGYGATPAPDVLRADLQMPGRRLWYETRKLFGMQGREWQMRPHAAARRAEGTP